MKTEPPIIQIALPFPFRHVFDYTLPNDTDEAKLKPGVRVKVPFGRRYTTGIFLNTIEESDLASDKLKPINSILDENPIISPSLLKLCQWASDYYHHPIGEVLFHAVPSSLRKGESIEIKQPIGWRLINDPTTQILSTLKRAPKQLALYELLRQHPEGLPYSEIRKRNFPTNIVNVLYKKELIESYEIKEQDFIHSKNIDATEIPSLNSEQQQAIQSIIKSLNTFNCFLLNGVTGSGKTEVYLHVIEQILKLGQQALVLIPEIALTPQTISRFKQRFSESIISLHSGLNHKERLNAWIKAKSGETKIVIGTRSAIFTPFHQLGIIVIDEEHDLSFKQQDRFRYSARDLAIVRANLENIPIVLGSATPSFEALHNAQVKRYQTLSLPERAGNAIHPNYHIIDIRNESLKHGLSKMMIRAIGAHLEQNNQVLLFLNRRGYAPTLMCHHCGWIAQCHRCDVKMTLHKQPPHLRCHHCDSIKSIPQVCPQCGNKHLQNIGVGTERLEHELEKQFPDIPIVRIDRDTTRKKNAINNLLENINQNKKQILIGTQMIAKGHHFPNVTLVGIINLDAGFFSADFRTTERMGQLLIQVSGRAGRAEKPGEVLIQTHYPQHPLLLQLLRQGYNDFAVSALKERKDSTLPPFTYFVLFRAEAIKETYADEFLQTVKELSLTYPNKGIAVLGPIPAPIQKCKGRFRSQLLLHSRNRKLLHDLLDFFLPKIETLKSIKKVKWLVEVDPMEM